MAKLIDYFLRGKKMRFSGSTNLTPYSIYAFEFKNPADDIELLPAAFLFVPAPGRDPRRGIYGINLMALTDPKLRVTVVNEYLTINAYKDQKYRDMQMRRLFYRVYRYHASYSPAYKYIPWARVKNGLFVELDPIRLREITREP